MLEPQHFFGVILFFLFIYLFGYGSFCKFLRGDTIVIETIEKTSDIPAPAITVVPFWKDNLNLSVTENVTPFDDPNNTCWFLEDVYSCLVEKYTYPLDDIIENATDFNSTSRFEPSQSLLFTLNPGSRLLTSKVLESLLVLVKWDTWRSVSIGGITMPDPDVLPSFYLHDPRYFTYTTNPRFMNELKYAYDCSLINNK